MGSVLQTYSITKQYGKVTAVDHVSIHLDQGDIYGLIGRNGAGKTTLMKMVSGIAHPTSGSYAFFEEEDNRKTVSRVGCMIEQPTFYPDLRVEDNLRFYNTLLGITDSRNIDELLEMVDLQKMRKKKTKQLSLGMKQRLGIAIALIGYPDVLILDEPINGLDPTGIVEVRNLLLKLNKERNMTLLISSHILGELSRMATKYGIIDQGVLVEELTHSELLERTRQAVRILYSDPRTIAVELDGMGISDYKVLPDGQIMVYCDPSLCGKINAGLGKKGIYVDSISVVGQDLETYFVGKMGGDVHE